MPYLTQCALQQRGTTSGFPDKMFMVIALWLPAQVCAWGPPYVCVCVCVEDVKREKGHVSDVIDMVCLAFKRLQTNQHKHARMRGWAPKSMPRFLPHLRSTFFHPIQKAPVWVDGPNPSPLTHCQLQLVDVIISGSCVGSSSSIHNWQEPRYTAQFFKDWISGVTWIRRFNVSELSACPKYHVIQGTKSYPVSSTETKKLP